MFIAVPVRTASELPYRLQDFELRMFYAADIAQPSAEVGRQVFFHFVIICAGKWSTVDLVSVNFGDRCWRHCFLVPSKIIIWIFDIITSMRCTSSWPCLLMNNYWKCQ